MRGGQLSDRRIEFLGSLLVADFVLFRLDGRFFEAVYELRAVKAPKQADNASGGSEEYRYTPLDVRVCARGRDLGDDSRCCLRQKSHRGISLTDNSTRRSTRQRQGLAVLDYDRMLVA